VSSNSWFPFQSRYALRVTLADAVSATAEERMHSLLELPPASQLASSCVRRPALVIIMRALSPTQAPVERPVEVPFETAASAPVPNLSDNVRHCRRLELPQFEMKLKTKRPLPLHPVVARRNTLVATFACIILLSHSLPLNPIPDVPMAYLPISPTSSSILSQVSPWNTPSLSRLKSKTDPILR
jgi:hypothetical protein